FFEVASPATNGAVSRVGSSAEELLSALASRLAGPLIPAGAVAEIEAPLPPQRENAQEPQPVD
ncbi:MAG TPA: hypothetical protein VM686_12195, partial [Polyangiaceae bacterium]|nr:hypothetical protein [Polyangiaceae bacterium]